MEQICSKFMELHVDNAGTKYQLVCGVGEMDDMSVMFIGHTMGWIESGVEHRALATRLMQEAEGVGFPIVAFIESHAGVEPNVLARDRDAASRDLVTMLQELRVPILQVRRPTKP